MHNFLHVALFSGSIQCGSGGPRTLKALGWCRSARRIGWKKDGAGGSSGSSTVAPSFHAEKKTEATELQEAPLAAESAQSVRRSYRNVSCP